MAGLRIVALHDKKKGSSPGSQRENWKKPNFVDPDGDGAATLDLQRRYLYGEAVDQILAQEDLTQLINSPSRVLFPLTDHLGACIATISFPGLRQLELLG